MYTWQSFGRELIESGDLDPIYIIVAEGVLDNDMLKRWLLAYWCYYHAGVASAIAELASDKFFDAMEEGINDKWPRGFERRHFRGAASIVCVDYLKEQGSPEFIVDRMTYHRTFQQVSNAVTSFYLFGPWIAWKVADMAERVLCMPIDFSGASLGVYRDPLQGAAMLLWDDWRVPITPKELRTVIDRQLVEFNDLMAPPYYDRRINIQEVETVLCKFKAHRKGFYPMGNDSFHILEALKGWGDLAESLVKWVPEIRPEWLDKAGKLHRDRT